jgi:hypothetical protein
MIYLNLLVFYREFEVNAGVLSAEDETGELSAADVSF